MKVKEILLEYDRLIPQPSTLKVDVPSYEFIQLMKEFRAEESTKAQGNQGLVMFYTDEEKQEFQKFLRSKGIRFEDIGTR